MVLIICNIKIKVKLVEINQLANIGEIQTFSSIYADHEKIVNALLDSNEWILISCSSGTDRDDYPIHGWVLGKYRNKVDDKKLP